MATKRPQFGVTLRELREARGMSIRTLARETGMSSTFLSKVERGEAKAPSEAKTRELARALGQGEDEFVLKSGRVPETWNNAMRKYPDTFADLLQHCCKDAELMNAIREVADITASVRPEGRQSFLMRLRQHHIEAEAAARVVKEGSVNKPSQGRK